MAGLYLIQEKQTVLPERPTGAKPVFTAVNQCETCYLCRMNTFLKDLVKGQSYDEKNFFLIAGPCVVESEELLMEVAKKVSGWCRDLGIPYIFKSSYRKANRTSAGSFTGMGTSRLLRW